MRKLSFVLAEIRPAPQAAAPIAPPPAMRQTGQSRSETLHGGNDDDGLGGGKIVGDGQVDAHLVTFGRQPGKRPRRASGQLQGGAPRRQIHHAHVAPEHALAEAGAERLGAGLLGGEALGVGGGARRPPVGFLPLESR